MLTKFFFLRSFLTLTTALALVLFGLVACSDDSEDIAPVKNTLEANAGADQNVSVNNAVMLNGSESTAGNGKPLTYKWTLKQKPEGSITTISNSALALSGFTPDKAGTYVVVLTISQGSFSDSDEVRIVVSGTDVPEEQQPVAITSNITSARVLADVVSNPNQPDYIVNGDIQVTGVLTIQPGVIIAFEQDKSMQVMLGGALIAEGTSAQPITFTGVQKQVGFWKGLVFATINSQNRLHYTIVEYGGSSELPESPRANISVPGDAISGSVLRISNSTVRYSGGYGIYVGGMSSVPEFTQLAFADNTGAALYCSPNNVSSIEEHTAFFGNGFDGVETGGLLNAAGQVTWKTLDHGTYRITSDLTIASDLEITPGAIFKISKNVLITVAAGAQLTAKGTYDANIVFEGISTIAQNAWRGISIQSNNENVFEYVVVRNTGYSELPGITGVRAGVGVVEGAQIQMIGSLLEQSIGWGVVLAKNSYYNDDIHTSNSFISVASGSVKFPEQLQPVNIAGEWVEFSSLMANESINENFYNRQTGEWFGGAEHPWSMTPQSAFGLKIDASGNYIWIIAIQHSPMTECFTYSAEHFTGSVTANGETLNFVEETWRSKYYNSCTPEESIDFDVEPGQMQLPYAITKEYNMMNGQEYTVLNITSGGQTFKLYKK